MGVKDARRHIEDVTKHRSLDNTGDVSSGEGDALFEDGQIPGMYRVKSNFGLTLLERHPMTCICALISSGVLLITVAGLAGTIAGGATLRRDGRTGDDMLRIETPSENPRPLHQMSQDIPPPPQPHEWLQPHHPAVPEVGEKEQPSQQPPEANQAQQPAPAPISPRPEDRMVCIRPGLCPLLFLFESPDVLDVVADNIMRVGHGFFAAQDRAMAREIVRTSFGNISTQLRLNAATVASELSQIDLTTKELHAVLNIMVLMTDPRVQDLGKEVSAAIRESPHPEDVKDLKKRIETKLMPRLEEILGLRTEVPEPLKRIWREDGARNLQWQMTLDPQNIRSMQKVTDDVVIQSTPESWPDDEKKAYAITGGALQQGRALLDVLQKCIGSFGPQLTTDIGATMSFAPAPLDFSCTYEQPHAADWMKETLCPLKLGAEGVDALRAAEEMAVPDGTVESS